MLRAPAEPLHYYRYAHLASKAERVNNYILAEELWLKAYEFCCCDANLEWVYRRLAFCRRHLVRNGNDFT
ncbi:ANR family transcriptional regulator [Escherichia coli]|uniref:ANR family transcriptional regulator n=1 Tax=Escherichia coli TaxID=562 RepID=UPI00388D3AA2